MARCAVHGCCADLQDRTGATPLHLAARAAQLPLATLLVREGGADVGATDGAGRTPLHYACQEGHYETAQFLMLTCGACAKVQDNNGRCAVSRGWGREWGSTRGGTAHVVMQFQGAVNE